MPSNNLPPIGLTCQFYPGHMDRVMPRAEGPYAAIVIGYAGEDQVKLYVIDASATKHPRVTVDWKLAPGKIDYEGRCEFATTVPEYPSGRGKTLKAEGEK